MTGQVPRRRYWLPDVLPRVTHWFFAPARGRRAFFFGYECLFFFVFVVYGLLQIARVAGFIATVTVLVVAQVLWLPISLLPFGQHHAVNAAAPLEEPTNTNNAKPMNRTYDCMVEAKTVNPDGSVSYVLRPEQGNPVTWTVPAGVHISEGAAVALVLTPAGAFVNIKLIDKAKGVTQ